METLDRKELKLVINQLEDLNCTVVNYSEKMMPKFTNTSILKRLKNVKGSLISGFDIIDLLNNERFNPFYTETKIDVLLPEGIYFLRDVGFEAYYLGNSLKAAYNNLTNPNFNKKISLSDPSDLKWPESPASKFLTIKSDSDFKEWDIFADKRNGLNSKLNLLHINKRNDDSINGTYYAVTSSFSFPLFDSLANKLTALGIKVEGMSTSSFDIEANTSFILKVYPGNKEALALHVIREFGNEYTNVLQSQLNSFKQEINYMLNNY